MVLLIYIYIYAMKGGSSQTFGGKALFLFDLFEPGEAPCGVRREDEPWMCQQSKYGLINPLTLS